ncbi:hypothetical protein ACROYT_G029655 [Oculina patagonica]
MIVFAVIYSLNAVVAFVGNLFVLLVVTLYRDFHNMRYLLLASLALSDLLMAVLVGNRAVATAVEEWIFGTTWCHGVAFAFRVLHLITVFHLCAVSYERYNAIVRRPLTYSSNITMKRASLNMVMLWILPALISLGPFIGWGAYVYNPDIFACEQKWDGPTTIPLSIATFVLPLGAIFFLNYKVLKVVLRLQNSVEIINQGLIEAQNKTPDGPHQHQQCSTESQREDRVRRRSRQKEEGTGIDNGEHRVRNTRQIRNMMHRSIPLNHGTEVQGEENAAYQSEPDDAIETIYQEEVVCDESGSTRVAQSRSYSLTNKRNNRHSVKTREDCPNTINKKTVGRGRSRGKKSLDWKKTQHTRHHVVEFDREDALAKKDIQVHLSAEDNQSSLQSRYGTLEVCNCSQGGTEYEVQTSKERSGFIQQLSFDQIITEDANGMEEANGSQSERPSREEGQKRHSVRKAKISPKFETHIADHEKALTEIPSCPVNSVKENCVMNSVLHGPFQDNHSEDPTPQNTECLPQGDSVQPNENHTQKQLQPPGKTQMRLAKLLKEGKAARDVMIIIGAFVLCYLPTWIMAMYRVADGVPSVQAILTIHWVYSLSMVCNPIIYSIRKQEFRKALRKLLKL